MVASCVLLAGLAWRIGAVVMAEGLPWLLPLALVIGYATADLLTGSVHWFCDSFFSPQTPIIGRVITPFRDHHDHPQRIVEYRFIEQDAINFFLMLTPLGWFWWSDLPAPGHPVALHVGTYLFGLCVGTFGTNLFHKWAHAPDVPRAIRRLQRMGLILNPQRHQAHHRDYSRGFCVTSGWMNSLLDPIGFFPRLERGIRAVLPTSRARDAKPVAER